MKNCRLIIVNILLLHLMMFSCNGQVNSNIKNQVDDKGNEKVVTSNPCELELVEISIDKVSVSGVLNGFNINKVQQKIGVPDSISTYDNEFSNKIHELLFYGESFIELMDGKVVSFEILDNRLLFERFDLTVGDNIKKCDSLLKLYQANKSKLEIRIPIEDEDSAIIFNLDSEGQIKSIYQWVNW